MTWTAPEVAEPEGPTTGPERPILAGYHAWQRAKLLRACAGLTGEQLAVAAVAPSTLTLLGLIRHLRKVERTWWRIRLAGEDVEPLFAEVPDTDFDQLDPFLAAEEWELLLAEWRTCDATAARFELDDEFDNRGETLSVRMLYVHLIGEYAQHNGHADLLRERVLAGE